MKKCQKYPQTLFLIAIPVFSHLYYMYSYMYMLGAKLVLFSFRNYPQMFCRICAGATAVKSGELRYEKTCFLHMQKQSRISAELISAFRFATQYNQSLDYLDPKIQASSHFLWLYNPICVGPGRKPRIPVFLRRGSDVLLSLVPR